MTGARMALTRLETPKLSIVSLQLQSADLFSQRLALLMGVGWIVHSVRCAPAIESRRSALSWRKSSRYSALEVNMRYGSETPRVIRTVIREVHLVDPAGTHPPRQARHRFDARTAPRRPELDDEHAALRGDGCRGCRLGGIAPGLGL